jgi:hypothetical protein
MSYPQQQVNPQLYYTEQQTQQYFQPSVYPQQESYLQTGYPQQEGYQQAYPQQEGYQQAYPQGYPQQEGYPQTGYLQQAYPSQEGYQQQDESMYEYVPHKLFGKYRNRDNSRTFVLFHYAIPYWQIIVGILIITMLFLLWLYYYGCDLPIIGAMCTVFGWFIAWWKFVFSIVGYIYDGISWVYNLF